MQRYAECAARPGLPLIQQAEKWLVQHPADADLYYTLGVLCPASNCGARRNPTSSAR